MADMTPMMRQYLKIKEENKDTILFFRLGDFYEMFNEDALLASRELDLTLTTRDRGKAKEDQTPMCGVPYHSSDAYIARLIAKGYKVAICEQMEDPTLAKGLVDRDIVRVITPGTVMDSSMLEEGRSNFICSIFLSGKQAGICFCDISTGKTHVTGFSGPDLPEHLCNELGRFSPSEAMLNQEAYENPALRTFFHEKLRCSVELGGTPRFQMASCEKLIRSQFGEECLSNLDRGNPPLLLALGGLLSYLYETQKTDLSHIHTLDYYRQGRFMELDLSARRNLELTETLRGKEKKGSLLWVLDKTKTAMGARMLRGWLDRPLLDVVAIQRRLKAVSLLHDNTIPREELTVALSGIPDMERLLSRIVYGSAGGRDMVSLRKAIVQLPRLKQQLQGLTDSKYLAELLQRLDPLEDIGREIEATICDDPPFSVREGGFIRDGFHAEVDRLRDILHGGKGTIAAVEARERERTGIRTLKVSYNKVFGYYIEVSNSFKEQVPEDYVRKQTLVNGERYITQELKDLEHTILTANDRIGALEFELFTTLRQHICACVERIQQTASAVAELDTLCSFATVAAKNHYCCPDIDESGTLEIYEGRHPVVEQMQKDNLFVPNDTIMNQQDARVFIITGPNMAGKSTYMRQVALITLMAQIGSFVPARSARIGVVDRIFTRIGASDDLSAGQSTFMVEMSEMAEILRRATSKSLLVLDEIGRGTSTYDGMSIARAVLEYCADTKKLGAKTLFATHYHELTQLQQQLDGVCNYSIAVKARGEDIIFLRKIVPGGADRSYGIEVAKLAGLPNDVVKRARVILEELETAQPSAATVQASEEEPQLPPSSLTENEVLSVLRSTQPDTLSPIEAMNLLYQLKSKLS